MRLRALPRGGRRRSRGIAAILLIGALGSALIAAGCGGGSSDSKQTAQGDHLVFEARDLPGVQDVEPPFPEPCGPVSVLKEGGGTAVLSKRFVLAEGEAVEAAAVFKNEKPARAVYRDLDELDRLRCIASAIEGLAPQVTVEFETPKPLDLGDEAAVTRYRIRQSGSGNSGYSNVIALRVGRCIASILVAGKVEEAAKRLTGSVSRTASRLLAESCG